MQILSDIRHLHLSGPTVLTIGNFDGLHRGHQALLTEVHRVAQRYAAQHANTARDLQTAILTFDPHPLRVLRPDKLPKLLTTPRERLAFAGELDIDLGILQPFTHEVAELAARDFMRLLKENLGLVTLVVGPDTALGRNREGDIAKLRTLGAEIGYGLEVMEPVQWQGKAVRSSIIRSTLVAGDVVEVADLLGRAYHVTGVVAEGDRLGRTIGIPTANLTDVEDKLLPANGVYATRTSIHPFIHPKGQNNKTEASTYHSVTNIGIRPTVDGLHHRVETHLLDYRVSSPNDELYGQTITIEFIARLRDEQRFPNLEALVQQIQADIQNARKIFDPQHSSS